VVTLPGAVLAFCCRCFGSSSKAKFSILPSDVWNTGGGGDLRVDGRIILKWVFKDRVGTSENYRAILSQEAPKLLSIKHYVIEIMI
jgi:hypothetical protein